MAPNITYIWISLLEINLYVSCSENIYWIFTNIFSESKSGDFNKVKRSVSQAFSAIYCAFSMCNPGYNIG